MTNMNDMNETIREFVEEFERKFGDCLIPSEEISREEIHEEKREASPILTPYFIIYKGKERYSDWDLHCCVKNKTPLSPDKLKSMERFVKEFPDFGYVGLMLMPPKVPYLNGYACHHIERSEWLHLMGFMEKEMFAPFADIHVWDVPNNLLRVVYSGISVEEFIVWMMLAYWRKWRNNDNKEHQNFRGLVDNILPCLDKEDREAAEKDPIVFFKEYLRNRDNSKIISFLE